VNERDDALPPPAPHERRGAPAERKDGPAFGRPHAAAARKAPPQPPASPPPSRPDRAARRVVAVALAVALVVAGYGLWALGPVDAGDDRVVVFEVPRGRSATGVARDLAAADLVRDARVARAYLVLSGADRRIGEGLYDLRRDRGLARIVDALVAGGRPVTARLLLPEGLRLEGVVERVADAGWPAAVVESFAEILAAPPNTLRPAGAPDDATLEGYLFPAVYELPLTHDAHDIAQALVARFEREASGVVRAELASLELDVHTWVTLASLVQAEAAGDHEMPIIAGVFLNRLDLGMPLQSDPTVAYGLGKRLPELDFPNCDFEIDHPWNTYTRGGVPFGPIGNPGAAALASVLMPERRDAAGRRWLYFLHGRDAEDTPVFRPNPDYESHLRDVDRYLR
jgi:UPF0755 protein